MILYLMKKICYRLLDRVIEELGSDRSSFEARGWVRYVMEKVENL